MKVTKRKNLINSITQTSGPFPSALREQWNRHDTLKNHFCLVSFYVLHCTYLLTYVLVSTGYKQLNFNISEAV